MEIIKKSITIVPFILLLSACTTIDTKETSVNKDGRKLITEKSAVSIDPSVTGFFSRLVNVFTGKPVMNVEPVVVPNPPIETKSQPVSEPVSVIKENNTEKETPQNSKCSFKKIVVETIDVSVSVGC